MIIRRFVFCLIFRYKEVTLLFAMVEDEVIIYAPA